MKIDSWLVAAVTIALIIAIGCATPSSPTGGPPDEQGPKIIKTVPETGTTNFSRQSIELYFSEFVDRGSLNQAIVIEPGIGISYELDWGRKSVEIEFDRAIPDSTTLIVTVGTDFQDTNGNGMSEPQKIAVSTGPEIDDGSLIGKVRNAESGEGGEGDRILLYREPINLSQKADYIAATDTGGTFRFSYLRQGTYKALWVEDQNRNKMWDRQRERAQPFSQELVELAKGATDTLGTVYKTPFDTTKPVLQGIGLFSSQRLRMRFSENITLTDSASIAITDTLGTFWGDAYPLYILPGERFVLFGQSVKPLSESSSYSMQLSGIEDEAGNPLDEINQNFTGSAQEDTTQQRIIQRNQISGYYPTDPITITFAKPIEGSAIRDSLKVVEGDTLIEKWPNVQIQQNTLILRPQKQWKDGLSYEVRVWDPKIEDYRKFEPDIWHQSQMGILNVAAADTTADNISMQIFNEKSGIRRDTTFADSVNVRNLPPLSYTVIAYQDRNGNNEWDFGQVDPFKAPEPYFIQQDVPVKQNMTGELSIIFEY